MTRGPLPLCLACSRSRHVAPDDPWTCDAYPDGIPPDILAGEDHRRPRGDEAGGLVFDPDPDQAELAAEILATYLR